MIFREMFTTLPIEFYAPVMALILLYTVWIIVDLVIAGKRVRKLRRELRIIESGIQMHQGCHIENLPLISGVFDSSSERIGIAFAEMMQASADYYHKRWIPDPADYFTIKTLTDLKTDKAIRKNKFHYFIILGLLLTVAIYLFAVSYLSTEIMISNGLVLSLMALVITALLTTIFAVLSFQWKSGLQDSINSLHRALVHKVPVFSENQGISLLVTQFIEYDRNMTKAVDTLSDKIDRFTSEGLVNAITFSIESTLREAVFPSIERANDAIVSLGKDIAVREDEGMKALALSFTSSVASELSYHLKPLVDQIDRVSAVLAESKNYIDVISQTVNIYKQNAGELHSLTAKTLQDYDNARQSFTGDISSISESLAEFNNVNKLYIEKIGTDMSKFETAVDILGNKMDESQKTLAIMLDAIFVEARNSEDNANLAQESASNYIQSMSEQIQTLSKDMDNRSKNLLEGLDEMIGSFFARQEAHIAANGDELATHTTDLLSSIKESAETIRSSTGQIKTAFDELEEARIREAEAKTKKSFFKRK